MTHKLKSPHLFALWWFVNTPKKIALIIKRFIKILNNQLSFTVNLRLLFTPLFGDYTIIGRFIGFVVRVFEIIFGATIVVAFAIFYPILPLAWALLPFFLIYKYGLVVLLWFAALYLVWSYKNRDIPEKTVSTCKDDYLKSFRPQTISLLRQININQESGIKKLTELPKIQLLLLKLELTDTNFIEALSKNAIQSKDTLAKAAFDFAKEAGAKYVGEIALLIAILKSNQNLDKFLSIFNAKLHTVIQGAKWLISERDVRNRRYLWQEDYSSLVLGGFGHGMLGKVTPFLDAMSEDFTKQAFSSGFERFAIRRTSIDKLADLLSANTENILVVGEAGSGKTSIVKGMAYNIMQGSSHKSLWNKRIVSLSLSGVLAGTKSVGEIAEKLKYAIREAKSSGDIILFIDEIHSLVAGSTSENPEVSAVFNLLEPELSNGSIQFIGATTMREFRRYIEPNSAFARLFHVYEIGEASDEETFEIMQYVVRDMEQKIGLIVTYKALEKCIELSKKLIHERVLPDKAIQILDRAATTVKTKNGLIDSKTVADVVAEITHVPSSVVDSDEAAKLLNIEAEMKKSVIGQDQAIKQIASALKRARAGIRNEGKPIASFLFVGTTGVGKTQTAKTLAKAYFGDSKAMVRLDMSEYQQLDSLSRLLGSPDGSTKGVLTEAIRTRPFALILLDEIEKAHPNILLTFLQVLDDGRLTDSGGTTIDFTNTIIISTSNVGTRSIQAVFERGENLEKMTEAVMVDVRTNFAPEFLNRFTGIIVFNPLSMENIREIVKLMLVDVTKSAQAQDIKISFNPDLVEQLIAKGYSKEWGARPLARLIEDTVETYIAEKLLSKQFMPGADISLGLEVFGS